MKRIASSAINAFASSAYLGSARRLHVSNSDFSPFDHGFNLLNINYKLNLVYQSVSSVCVDFFFFSFFFAFSFHYGDQICCGIRR